MGKRWQPVGRKLIGETHHCTFTAALCALMPTSVPIIPATFDAVAGKRRHHLSDATRAVGAMLV
jgi:hypothetical protein